MGNHFFTKPNFKKLLLGVKKYKLIFIVFFTLYLSLLALSILIPIGFDDSYYMLVSKNLALYGKYATNNEIFDPNIALGFPVLLPVAVIFKIISLGVFQTRIVMVGYFLGFIISAFFITLKIGINNKKKSLLCLVLFLILCFFTIKGFIYPIFNTFGEIPSLFYFMLSLIFLDKFFRLQKTRYVLFSGILLGLSVSTKYLMLIAVTSTFFSFLIYLKNKTQKKKNIKSAFILFGSMLIPELLFQLYHLLSSGYKNFVIEIYKSILHYKIIDSEHYEFPQTGNALFDHVNLFKIYNYLPFAPIFVLVLTIILFIYAIKNGYYILANLCIFVFINYIWWFFISHNLLIIHLLPGTVIFNLILSFVIVKLIQTLLDTKPSNKPKLLAFLIFTIITAITQLSYYIVCNNLNFVNNMLLVREQEETANFVISNYNGNYYYGKFDQAPDISFLANKKIIHLYDKNNSEISTKLIDYTKSNNYLIVTSMRLKNDPQNYYSLINKKCKEIVLKTYDYLICKI